MNTYELKNFKRYTELFHDGALFDIRIEGRDIFFHIESAEMDPEEFTEGFRLTEDDRIRGILCLKNVSAIVINDVTMNKPIWMISDDAEIADLELYMNAIILNIKWEKFGDREFRDFTSNKLYFDDAVFYIEGGKIPDYVPPKGPEKELVWVHSRYNHFHRRNPNSTGRHDKYMDGKGNPIAQGSCIACLYRPENIWWESLV
ncbi:MAG: hypothetical protein ACOYK9_01520 [Chlamydiia bacterium]